MRCSSRPVALVLGLAVALGCASMPTTLGEPGSSAAARLPPSDMTLQALYRLTYDGGEGRTTLKVVLRQGSGNRFQLVFSDLAGRRVWGLDHGSNRSVLVDYRNSAFCVSGPELRLPEVHPEELPLAAVPRVLSGELPVPGEPGEEGEFVDREGRRWRAVYRGANLESWSLLDSTGPSLWWQPDREGGILSRRGGTQYRWSLVVSEPTLGEMPDLVPEGFREEVCADQGLP